jgi:hypothetical protein
MYHAYFLIGIVPRCDGPAMEYKYDGSTCVELVDTATEYSFHSRMVINEE